MNSFVFSTQIHNSSIPIEHQEHSRQTQSKILPATAVDLHQ